jgi:hypothetical protein
MGLDGWAVNAWPEKDSDSVQAGDSWVPRKFKVWAVKNYGDFDVDLACTTENGRSVGVSGCFVSSHDPGRSSPWITTSLLRQIPLTALARVGMGSLAMRRDAAGAWEQVIPDDKRHRWGDVTIWQTDGPPEDDPRTAVIATELEEEWVARLEEDYGKLVEAKRGAGVRDGEWWQRLARAYIDALENGEPRGEAVAKAMHLSTQAAKNAITQARKNGYDLPKRGRMK